jgi:hypothetical protein
VVLGQEAYNQIETIVLSDFGFHQGHSYYFKILLKGKLIMALDKLEAVKKVSETLNKQSMNPAEEMERMASNKEHFQSLIDSSQPLKPTSFERVDTKAFAPAEIENVEIEKKPVFAEENVSSQKSGTATDQERKRKRQPETEEIEGVAAAGRPKKSAATKSLMDEVGKLNTNVSKMSQLTPEGIQNQAKNIIAQIDQVKTQLSQAQTEIKPSYQTLLRNRLSHIDDNLKIALSKAGVEYTPPPNLANTGNKNPIERFINFLSNSQSQLENLDGTIGKLNMEGMQITPANMLAIQLKMSYVQQQIELFTSLLNKALESTKTIMNVQV